MLAEGKEKDLLGFTVVVASHCISGISLAIECGRGGCWGYPFLSLSPGCDIFHLPRSYCSGFFLLDFLLFVDRAEHLIHLSQSNALNFITLMRLGLGLA